MVRYDLGDVDLSKGVSKTATKDTDELTVKDVNDRFGKCLGKDSSDAQSRTDEDGFASFQHVGKEPIQKCRKEDASKEGSTDDLLSVGGDLLFSIRQCSPETIQEAKNSVEVSDKACFEAIVDRQDEDEEACKRRPGRQW